MDLQELTIHDRRVAYRSAGHGPVVLLIHGMAGSGTTWKHVMPALSKEFTVVAPDLLGHGRSDKEPGDYSLGAFASMLRDLLVALGHERATVVGQSLGGGIAMQLAYQHPERCERLVLVGSGGLGREVNPILRLLTFPGADSLLRVASAAPVRRRSRRPATGVRESFPGGRAPYPSGATASIRHRTPQTGSSCCGFRHGAAPADGAPRHGGGRAGPSPRRPPAADPPIRLSGCPS